MLDSKNERELEHCEHLVEQVLLLLLRLRCHEAAYYSPRLSKGASTEVASTK